MTKREESLAGTEEKFYAMTDKYIVIVAYATIVKYCF
jgi:hypothetical protein